jgi:hypothetical protein
MQLVRLNLSPWDASELAARFLEHFVRHVPLIDQRDGLGP